MLLVLAMLIAPEAEIPLVLPTVPIVRAMLLERFNELIALAAIVPIELIEELSVKVPAPLKSALVVVIDPVWLAVPVVEIDKVPKPDAPAND